jgi:hypothetical protein
MKLSCVWTDFDFIYIINNTTGRHLLKFTDTHYFADHIATSKDHISLLVGLSSVTSGKCRDTTLKYTMKTFLLNAINCVFFVTTLSAAFATNFATKHRNIKRNKTKMRSTVSMNHQYHYPHNNEPVKSAKLRTTDQC